MTLSSLARLVFVLVGLLCGPLAPRAAAEEPQVAFTWATTSQDLGLVTASTSTGSTWWSGPQNVFYRPIPSFSGDPTYEVIARPPASGHPTRPERFILQLPADFLLRPFSERALVVAFHSYGVSEKEIFLHTDLPFECRQRGWMLLAPYGLVDTHFANKATQDSLENIAHIIFRGIPFNYRRVYGVGFSMGGLMATSFGMRHVDRGELQFAGLVVHTPPLDMKRVYDQTVPTAQDMLADAEHFGATPTDDLFAYERVSPVRFLTNGLVDDQQAPVTNVLHLPIFLHANLADPLPNLVTDLQELRSFLLMRGAQVMESLVFDAQGGHSWSTLPLGQALDFLAPHSLSSLPDEAEVFADRPGGWFGTKVRVMESQEHARFLVERSPVSIAMMNSFRVEHTENLHELAVELAVMGLDCGQPLSFLHSTADGSSDVLRLVGYPAPPSAVFVDGVQVGSWLHDAASGELELTPSPTGQSVRVDIQP